MDSLDGLPIAQAGGDAIDMAKKKHISDGVYIRTACGRYMPVDTDGARWAEAPGRGVCKHCAQARQRQTRALLESVIKWEPDPPHEDTITVELCPDCGCAECEGPGVTEDGTWSDCEHIVEVDGIKELAC